MYSYYSCTRDLYKKYLLTKQTEFAMLQERKMIWRAEYEPYCFTVDKIYQAKSCPIVMNTWVEHFSDILYRHNCVQLTCDPTRLSTTPENAHLNRVISCDEVYKAVHQTKNRKAAGPDLLTYGFRYVNYFLIGLNFSVPV